MLIYIALFINVRFTTVINNNNNLLVAVDNRITHSLYHFRIENRSFLGTSIQMGKLLKNLQRWYRINSSDTDKSIYSSTGSWSHLMFVKFPVF